ncbi:hypothetical protein F4604DRAFT_1574529, partial [Suillus subluteus]
SIRLKKEKPRNSHLPNNAQNSSKWCSKFLPLVMYWIGTSDYPWTIPNEELSDICNDIYLAVYHEPGSFEVDGYCFNLVCQRILEWMGTFGSTAITVLIMFFSLHEDFKTPEAQKEYAEYQLQDLRFVYENLDNKDSPGAFLSEFILCVFAAHFNTIHGYEKIDLIDTGLSGHQTMLALATAAVVFCCFARLNHFSFAGRACTYFVL